MLKLKNFDFVLLENSEYNFMIYSTSYESPFACIDEISSQLKQYNQRDIKVLFDLLLSSGNTSERFVEAKFDGETFDKTSFKFVRVDKKNDLRIKSRDFYRDHLFMLENSVLNSAQVKLLSKGICI